MALTDDEAARLSRLRAARDRVLSGEAVTSVQSGARRSDFAAPDPEALKREIEALEAKAGGRRRGAIGFRL